MAPPPGKRPAPAAAGGARGGKRQPPKARLPEGLELTDLKKQPWRVGRVIGEGGFGLVYLGSGGADGSVDCVVKAEPKGNGPLFCEMHFYQRAADGTRVADWARQRGLDYVGVPRFYGCGHVSHGGVEHRFLAIERLGEDMEKQFVRLQDHLGRLPARRAFQVAGLVLDALEFVHDSGYAHADVKASNLLTGSSVSAAAAADRVYLADFGLAFRYFADGKWLKEEKEDPKRRHDGTSEFCSRDAHRGLAPTPRADLENLGWCLVAWLTGQLPWQTYREASERVQRAKEAAIADIPAFLRGREFARPADAEAVGELLRHAASLGYHQRPDYRRVKDFLKRRADAPDKAAAAAVASANVGNRGTSAASAATAKPRRGGTKSPRATAATAAKGSKSPKSAVAKASPRSTTNAKNSAVAKASPRSTTANKETSAQHCVAMTSPMSTATNGNGVVKSPTVARVSPRPAEAAGGGGGSSSASADLGSGSSRKRKSGFCQTSPELLKEAKRLARAAGRKN